MASIIQYRVFCLTDGRYENWYIPSNKELPTSCPVNTSHIIDPTQTTIIDTLDQNIVKIKEEDIPTGGNFRTETVLIEARANDTTEVITSWPYPISILALEFVTKEEHEGDLVHASLGKNTIIGVTLTPLMPATTWIKQDYYKGESVNLNGKCYTCIQDTVGEAPPPHPYYWKRGYMMIVSPTVLEYVAIGFTISLDDLRGNLQIIGDVISSHTATSCIWVEGHPSTPFMPMTYVRLTVYTVRDYVFGPPWQNIIGESKIGGSYVPADIELSVEYINKSDNDKIFIGRVEYLF